MKKIISTILIIASLFTAMVSVTTAVEYENVPEEVVGLLDAISFMDDEGFSENEVLTRAEFCNMICKLFKYENYATSEMTFRDIDSTHPYYESVSALFAKGAVKGVSKYSMAPNRSITLEEAGIITICALGFEEMVQSGMTTYTAKASELGIYDGIAASKSAGLTEESAILMMYNILFAPIMTYLPDGEAISYSSNPDIIMMNEVYDMYKVKGVIRDNGITSFYGESNINKGEIKLDNDLYLSGSDKLNDLLGYPITGYAVENVDDDYDTLIYAYPDEKNLNEVEVLSEDIVSATKALVEYQGDKRVYKAKISSSADCVYNGVGVESFDETTITPEYGKIKLIDYDGDEAYDVIFVTEYQLWVVTNAAVNENEIYVYGKSGEELDIKRNEIDCTAKLYVNGVEKDLSEIKTGTVMLAVDSGTRGDIRLIDFYIVSEKVEGTLSFSDDEEISVDGRVIEKAPILSGAGEVVGKPVTCYIDPFGKAVYIESDGAGKYGFLYKAVQLDENERIQVKILDADNQWNTYLLREKLRSNGKSVKDIVLYAELSERQLVRYSVNEDGEISNLDLAKFEMNSDGLTISKEKDAFYRENGYFRKSLAKVNRRFAHNTKGLFDGQGYNRWVECFFPDQVTVLVRPESDKFEEKDVLFYNASYFKTDYDYVTEVFDLTENNYAPLVLVYGDSTVKVSASAKALMVDRIVEELDEDEMTVRKMYAWTGNTLTGYLPTEKTSFDYNGSEVKRGDIIRVATNFSDEVEYVENKLIFRVDKNPEKWFTDKSDSGVNGSAAYGYNQVAIGRVGEVIGDYLSLKVKNNDYINARLRTATEYYIYDATTKDVISKGSMKDIRVGDVVVMRLYFGRLDQVFVYKNM